MMYFGGAPANDEKHNGGVAKKMSKNLICAKCAPLNSVFFFRQCQIDPNTHK